LASFGSGSHGHWFKFLNFFSEQEMESGIVKKLKPKLEQENTLWLEPDLKSELAPKPPKPKNSVRNHKP
jgi:hypothetical protein